jgi:uncharacterized protein (TIGR03437 family)
MIYLGTTSLARFVDPNHFSRGLNLATAVLLLVFAYGWAAVPANGQACSDFNLDPSDQFLDFGTAVPGQIVSRTVTVTPVGGTGTFTLSIQNQDPEPAFTVTGSLLRNSAVAFTVVVNFQPKTSNSNSWSAELRINAGACGNKAVFLVGENFGGSHTADVTDLDFGTAAIGQGKQQQFTVSASTDPAAPLRITVTSNNPAISVNPASPFQIDNNSPRQVTVTYTPILSGRLTNTRVVAKAEFASTGFPVPNDVTVDINGFGFGIVTTFLPEAPLGCAYRATVAADGGALPYTWSMAGGSLPAGLTLDGETGVISGTPTELVGRTNFSVRATDGDGLSHARGLFITVRSPKPILTAQGFLDAAGFSLPPAAGGLGSVFGTFCVETGSAPEIPLPTEINGTRLLLGPPSAALTSGANDTSHLIPAPLLFVSGDQINFQIPWELASSAPGSLQAVVEARGVASDPVEVAVARHTPSIFAFDAERPARGIVLNLDYTVAQPSGAIPGLSSRPAQRGGVIIIYATGLGPVSPPPQTGGLGLDDQGGWIRRDTTETAVVRVGGIPANVSFAGLSPDFVGLYQVNAALAANTPLGDAVPITIQIGGQQSPADITIAVSQ